MPRSECRSNSPIPRAPKNFPRALPHPARKNFPGIASHFPQPNLSFVNAQFPRAFQIHPAIVWWGTYKFHRRATTLQIRLPCATPARRRFSRLIPGKQKKNRRRIFHRAPKTEPRIQRHVAHRLGGNVAQIQHDQSEAAALQQQIRGAQRLIDVVAAHPEKIRQIHSGRFRGIRIEASRPSTRAQTSPSTVREASAANSKLVRPEHGGPQISVKPPRGNPPVRSSISAIPAETVSAILRSRYSNGERWRPARARSTSVRSAEIFAAMGDSSEA